MVGFGRMAGVLEEMVEMEGCWKGWKGGRGIGRWLMVLEEIE